MEEPKISVQQACEARKARFAKTNEARDKVKDLQTGVLPPNAEYLTHTAEKHRLRDREKAGEWRKKMLIESKNYNKDSKLEIPLPQYVRRPTADGPDMPHTIKDGACMHTYKAQHKITDSKKVDGVQDPSHLNKASNIVGPILIESLSIDHSNNSPVQVDSLTTGLSQTAGGVVTLPPDNSKTPFFHKNTTLKQPTILPTVSSTVSSNKHFTQSSTLRTDNFPIELDPTSSSTHNNKSKELVTLEAERRARLEPDQQAKHIFPNLKTDNAIGINLRHSESAERIQVECDTLEDEKMKPLKDLEVGFDGTGGPDGSFEGNEHQNTSRAATIIDGRPTRSSTLCTASSTSVTPAAAVPSSSTASITRDTSFSTRPSRKAGRMAAAVMAASRKKNKAKGIGGSGASAPAPPPTTSAPPPPPPPPPRGSSGGASDHNKTWGFTEGPNGPWIEPPVMNDPTLAGPSRRKNLKKEVKETIAQLEKKDPDYDPHASAAVRNQATMYKLRVQGATNQWPTSNTRGAVDWEEVQKRRLGVAVREAMKQAEDEEKAEEMEKQRKAKMTEMASTEKDNGEGSTGLQGKTKYANDGEESVTTKAGFDMDCVEHKSDDDEDATLIGGQSDDDDVQSFYDADLDTFPRPSNGIFAQRFVAQSKAQLVDPRFHVIPPAGNTGITNDTDQGHNNTRGQSVNPFSFRADFSLHRGDERSSRMPRHLVNNPTAHQAASTPFDFHSRNLVASGQIGGASDNRQARPAPGPYVFGGRDALSSQEEHNARMMDLMERHLGLQLESPPLVGEAFPTMTGEWPQSPTTGLTHDVGPFEDSDGDGRAGAPNVGPFGEGPLGSSQHRPAPGPQ